VNNAVYELNGPMIENIATVTARRPGMTFFATMKMNIAALTKKKALKILAHSRKPSPQ
jgi:hypothetical protein